MSIKTQSGILKDVPFTLDENNFNRNGYKFIGWSTNPKSKEIEYSDQEEVKFNEDTVLYAIWSKNKYTITYDGNGGIPERQSDTIDYKDEIEKLPNASWTYHRFDGWINENEEPVTEPFKVVKSEKLTATWTALELIEGLGCNLVIPYHRIKSQVKYIFNNAPNGKWKLSFKGIAEAIHKGPTNHRIYIALQVVNDLNPSECYNVDISKELNVIPNDVYGIGQETLDIDGEKITTLYISMYKEDGPTRFQLNDIPISLNYQGNSNNIRMLLWTKIDNCVETILNIEGPSILVQDI